MWLVVSEQASGLPCHGVGRHPPGEGSALSGSTWERGEGGGPYCFSSVFASLLRASMSWLVRLGLMARMSSGSGLT